MTGWALYEWKCPKCGAGRSLADHDRREWPEKACTGSYSKPHRRVTMTLTVKPLVVAGEDPR